MAPLIQTAETNKPEETNKPKNKQRTISIQPPNSGNNDPLSIPIDDRSLFAEADKIDAARQAQALNNPTDRVLSGDVPNDAGNVAALPVADPAIAKALTFLVSQGVRLLHVRFEWSEPEDDWKKEVGELGALLIDKYMPDFLKNSGPETALVLLVAPYVLENTLKAKPTTKDDQQSASGGSDSDPRAEGLRQDFFAESTIADAQARDARLAKSG